MMIGYNFIFQFRQLIFFIRDTHRLQESSENIRIKQKSEVTKRGRGREALVRFRSRVSGRR